MNEIRSKRRGLHRSLRWLAIVLLLVSPAASRSAEGAAGAGGYATLIELNGPIGPAMSHYVEQSLVEARKQGSPIVILQMDTPGGLDTSMRDIIRAILASPVPVVTYVAPSGARAASAGTYILYASHFAAMAPATNLGAATPISIGGEPSVPPAVNPGGDKQKSPEETAPGSAEERKAVNDAVAYIRSLAQLRGRNAVWAESAVRGAASLSSSDALEEHVVDVVAKDVPDLLRQLQGRKIRVADREIVLDTQALAVKRVVPDWRTRALGLALMALGVGLIVAEFFMPAFGSLGIGGLAAFVIGSIILFDNQASGLRVALPLILGIAVAGGLVIAAIGWLALRARRRPLSVGVETMVGAAVEVVNDCQDRCVVRYGAELWNARSSTPLHAGQRARIVKVVQMTLWVEPQQD